MPYWVYILTNTAKNGTLYVGVTNDLVRRVHEHRQAEVAGFTRRYALRRLVHFEAYDDPRTALQREKNLKRWRRDWKIALIEEANPSWRDLYEDITA
ncbi:MAG: GIY-YIG nuclease family protein [Geminicoccaceae bacterium]